MKLRHLLLASALLASPAIGAPNSYPPPGSGGASVSLSAGNGLSLSPSPITGTGTISLTNTLNAQVGTTYTVVSGDAAKVITGANAGAQTYTLPQAGTTGFGSGYGATIYDVGAGALTINTTTSTFGNGATALGLVTGQGVDFISDGTNWRTLLGLPVMAQDTLLGNPAASNYPTAMTLPGCASDGSHALTYASHALACTVVSGTAASMTVGTTTVLSGTTTKVLSDNAGVLGEYTISGSGNVAMTTSPAFTTPSLGAATATGLNMSGTSTSQLNLGTAGHIDSNGSNKIDFSSGNITFAAGSGSLLFSGVFAGFGASGAGLATTTPTDTAPSLFINWSGASTTGWGGTVGSVAGIIAGVTKIKLTTEGLQYKQVTAPVPTGTGSPTIATGSTDEAGEVTSGTSATSVIITFNLTHTNAPFCVVHPQAQIASFAYTLSNTAITITMTATSAAKIDYRCTFP